MNPVYVHVYLHLFGDGAVTTDGISLIMANSSNSSSSIHFFGRPTGRLGVTGALGIGFSFHVFGIVSSA